MLHCDLRVRWKVASDLRFRAAISEPKAPSCCGISGDLAPSTRKSLAIAIVRFGALRLGCLLGICSDFARNLLGTRSSLGVCSEFARKTAWTSHARNSPHLAKIITKSTFQKNCFGTIHFVNLAKQSLYKANSVACFLANRDKPVVATLQRKCLGVIIFAAIITKIITKIIVPRNHFVITSASADYAQETF